MGVVSITTPAWRLLRDAAQRCGLTGPLEAMSRQDPHATALLRDAALLVSDFPRHASGQRLLDAMVSEALAVHHGAEGCPDATRLDALRRVVLRHAGELLHVEILSGGETWDPSSSPPLALWCRGRPRAQRRREGMPEEGARRRLAARLFRSWASMPCTGMETARRAIQA